MLILVSQRAFTCQVTEQQLWRALDRSLRSTRQYKASSTIGRSGGRLAERRAAMIAQCKRRSRAAPPAATLTYAAPPKKILLTAAPPSVTAPVAAPLRALCYAERRIARAAPPRPKAASPGISNMLEFVRRRSSFLAQYSPFFTIFSFR